MNIRYFFMPLVRVTTIIVCATMFTLISSPSMAFSPPIGIPDPGVWGKIHPVDSTAPDTATKCPGWPNALNENCYYIDNTHQQATDTNNTYGFPGKPRATIPTSYPAGAYIEIHGGPYSSNLTLTTNGTVDNPVWFIGRSGSLPLFTGKLTFSNSQYTIVEYIDFNGGSNTCISITGEKVNNIVIRNSKFRNRKWTTNSAAIASTPGQGGAIHDLVFYNNLFHNLGDWQVTEDQDFHGINPDLWGRTPPTTQYNVWALNNTGYNISGNLVQFNGDQRDVVRAAEEGRTETNLKNFHHLYVGRNYGHHNRQDICVMKFTTDGIISQNVTHDNYNNAAGGGTGSVFQEGPNYVWIIFNKIYNLKGEGIRQSNMLYPSFQTNKTFMIGNVIYNIGKVPNDPDGVNSRYKSGQAITFEKGNHKRYIVNNTIYNVAGGISTVGAVSTDVADISGNVIAGLSGYDSLSRPDYHISRITEPITIKIDYNYFQPRLDDGTVRFYWQAASLQTFTSLASFQSATSQCSNCWSGNPLFNNPASGNFWPQSTSPLIGKGIRHAVYDEFEARYGLSIAYDIEGKPRPAKGAWTLGAYEGTTGLPTINKVIGQ